MGHFSKREEIEMFVYWVLFDLDGLRHEKRMLGNPSKGIGKRIKRLNDQYLIAMASNNNSQQARIGKVRQELLYSKEW